MHLSQEVVDRLLLAKGLLAKIRFDPTAHPDRISLAQFILAAHNAAELAIAAVATHLGKLPNKKQCYLMDYFPEIKKEHPNKPVAGQPYFSQLNSVRIGIKHEGNFPEPNQWKRVGERTYEYVSEWCQEYLGLSLDELDESVLIRDEKVKEWHKKAKEALEHGQFRESLEHLAYATEALFSSNRALRGLIIGKSRAEDAIKLAAFGVHANDYLALQEFLPSLVLKRGHDQPVVKWEQDEYGHPGNWTRYAAEFALKTFVDVALRIQDADWIPGAIEFDILYEHKITALEDGVEITQDKTATASKDLLNPERVVIKTLNKGESLRGWVKPKSPRNILESLFGQERPVYSIITSDPQFYGEFEADKVCIICVPKDNDFVREHFRDLPEVEYKPTLKMH
jgi:hypothetical protein